MKYSNTFIRIIVAITGILISVAVAAQNAEQAPQVENEVTTQPSETTAMVSEDSTALEMQKLADKLQAQESRLENLESIASAQKEETEKLKDEVETAKQERDDLATLVLESSTGEELNKFSVFGFMDTSFTMVFPQNYTTKPDWNSPVFALTPRKSTFYMSNVNLFFKSEMTNSLEVLIETKFTFQPSGNVDSYPVTTYIKNGDRNIEFSTSGEWARRDTTVSNAYTGDFRLGGVSMVRAQFDWKPRDWFKARVGRYLTPYGIWNEDHGSPVIISTTMPLMISHNFIPESQTGLMLFGTVFPSRKIDLSYAFTVSNGRGPSDEFYDLNRNKALGLRAKVNMHFGDFNIAAGTYGYYGKYADTKNVMKVYLDETASAFNPDMDHPVQYDETVTKEYKEYFIAADLKMEFKGLELMGEYVRGKIEYLTATPIDQLKPLLIGSKPTLSAIEANYVKQATYGILAYELPIKKLKDKIKIKPFVGIDYLSPNDVYDYDSFMLIQMGLNIKPSSFVTLKTNAYYILPTANTPIADKMWLWTTQIAVSF
ncbi:MAG: hypothetical protein JXR91_01410 [Deltaproteobacteria bacterium]|nr:hypothetical protein [Deltaproteobacteria bacterium]